MGIDTLFDEAGYPGSDDCVGQLSSTDELGVVKGNEVSEEVMLEREEAEDLEVESEAGGKVPTGVRARVSRRLVAGIRIYSDDVGSCVEFSAILPGPASKES